MRLFNWFCNEALLSILIVFKTIKKMLSNLDELSHGQTNADILSVFQNIEYISPCADLGDCHKTY